MPGGARAVLLCAVLLLGATCSEETPAEREPRPSLSPAEVEAAVTTEGIEEHLSALQEIADANDGNRAAGTDGHWESVRYFRERLRKAGYDVRLDYFTFPFFDVVKPVVLKVKGGPRFEDGIDHLAMIYSASGSVTGPLAPVAFDPEEAGHNGPGCSIEAFVDVEVGDVVLLRPGPCLFRDQVMNAQDAGAAAVLLSFPEFTEATGVLRPTLFSPDEIAIPALALTNEAGIALNAAGGLVTVRSEVINEQRMTPNLIAESKDGDADQVVMAGGHLDSVLDGPGINDNGSGTATLLEVAEEMAGMELDNKVRFAFWSAEEVGLLGSTHYVESLGSSLQDIAVYLNFDMVASPNYVRYVYDDTGAPEGSSVVRDFFKDYFALKDLPLEKIDIEGRSDHGPFLWNGIPIGGLFTGADMLKSPRERGLYGGTAGEYEDQCYHKACDDLGNVDETVLGEMAGAITSLIVELTTRGDPLN